MAEKLNKDAVYRTAKPKDKDYTINDGGGGLALLVKRRALKRGASFTGAKASKIG